jgi:hypothetical protein
VEIVGQRVKAEDGQEGIVLAVAHVGGGVGTCGWQLLILNEDNRILAVVSALNALLGEPEGPLVAALDR